MRKDKQKAEQLRRSGKSYKEIRKILGIPTATLSGWFKDLPWSIEIRDNLATTASFSYPDKLKLMVAAIKKKYDTLHTAYRNEAIKEFPSLKKDPMFVAGLMLYWGEGDSKVENSLIRLSNSDPAMIRAFYVFLVNKLLIPKEKIVLNLLLYPDLIDSVQKNFWSMATGIPHSQFRKSVVIQGRHPTKRLAYGVGMIRVGGRKCKEKLMKWIELYKLELCNQIIA